MFKNVQKQVYLPILIVIFTMIICGVTAATNVTATNSSADSNITATSNATTSGTLNVITKTKILKSKNLTTGTQKKPTSEAESTSIAIPPSETFIGQKSVQQVNGVSSQNRAPPKRINRGPPRGHIGPMADRRDNSLHPRIYEFDPNFPKPRYRAHHYIDPQNHRMDMYCQTNLQYRYKPRNTKHQKMQSRYHRINSYQRLIDPKRLHRYNPKMHPDHRRVDPRYHQKMQHNQHKDPNRKGESYKFEQ